MIRSRANLMGTRMRIRNAPAITTELSLQPLVKPRAQRFPIQTPVSYRASGETEWSQGTTVNISRSGVLFRAGREIEPKTVFEMRILFPPEITGGVPANVVCWGPAVRSESGGSLVAAAILKYRFTRE
jgi:hypothetical protein